jgi:D-alanyl-D-alanine carboxypeptidase
MTIFRGVAVGVLISLASPSQAAHAPPAKTIESYIAPYVRTNNFSGVVLAARDGVPVFAKAYGFADRGKRIRNSLKTRFHIASMSMQFTAAAALRLIDQGKLSLDTPVADVVPGYPNGRQITVRHLLSETSGIADINAQDDYAEVLKTHQTPLSLVERIRNLPPLRKPGTFEREEHSAYNLLALMIERKAGVPFAEAVRSLVFRPLGMNDSGIDDDSPSAARNVAKGYQPAGLYGVEPADPIHWSAKAGNGSAYSTASDELKFATALLGDKFLSPGLRSAAFDIDSGVGYGWFKARSKRFGQAVYSMNGRSPGFSSAVAYLTRDRLLVLVLSNLYDSAPSDVSLDVAAMLSGHAYEPLTLKTSLDASSLEGLPVSFQFDKDFYVPNALVRMDAPKGHVSLDWPTGIHSALIPTSKDHFMDRNFWVRVEIVRDGTGRIEQLKYGPFTGQRR